MSCHSYQLNMASLKGRAMAGEKKVELGLRTHHLNDGLFAKIAKGCGLDLRSWKPLALKPVYDSKGEESVTCFISNVVKQDETMSDKVSGLNCFEITGVPLGQDGGQEQTVKVAMKVKVTAKENLESCIRLLTSCYELPEATVRRACEPLGEMMEHSMEINFYEWGRGEPEIAPIMPKVYYTEIDKDTEIFLFVMEFFDRAKMGMMDEMGSDLWDREKICTILKDLAKFHAAYFQKVESVKENNDFAKEMSSMQDVFVVSKELWTMQLPYAATTMPEVFTPEMVAILHAGIDGYINEVAPFLKRQPMTLSHNDFHAGNICYRLDKSEDQSHVCAYDWEFVGPNVPHRDVIMLLLSTLPVSSTREAHRELWEEYINLYRDHLIEGLEKRGLVQQADTKEFLMEDNFHKVAAYSALEVAEDWVTFCASIPRAYHLKNMEKVSRNLLLYIDSVREKFDFLNTV